MKKHFDTIILRVERPNFDNGLTPAQKAHPSETHMDNYNFDFVLLNNGSLESFKEKMTWFADNYLLK